MTLNWRDEPLNRPDRYLDWEARNRIDMDGSERWVPVLLSVRPGDPGDPAANLKRLKRAAEIGKVDPDTGMIFRVVVNGDERRRLDKLIGELDHQPSAMPQQGHVLLDFYVYAHEEDIYAPDGRYRDRPGFNIVFAGPPIPASFDARFGLQPTELPELPPQRDGIRPVAIGIIDDSIAFAHERFRSHIGGISTRISAFWRQEIEQIESDSVVFGQVFTKTHIDHLFKTESPQGQVDDDAVYCAAGSRDFGRRNLDLTTLRRAHGTHVMDLAAGFDPNNMSEQEEAAYFPILAVQLPNAVTVETSGMNMGSYVLQGLRQIMLWADEFRPNGNSGPAVALPLVVNFSYGITAGPKDGHLYLEKEIARLVAERNTRAPTTVVLPAGNSFLSRMTAAMKLERHIAQHLDWMILPDDATPSFAEIWFNVDSTSGTRCPIKITLTPPDSGICETLVPGAERVHVLADDRAVCGVYYDVSTRPDGTRRARIFLAANPTKSWDDNAPLAPSGRWRITLQSDQPLMLDLNIQRDDSLFGFRTRGRQSFLTHPLAYERDPLTGDYDALDKQGPITHAGTLSAIGTGMATVLVGAAEDVQILPVEELGSMPTAPGPARPSPAPYTSSGPTPRRDAPDSSAIAEDGVAFPGVLAAGSASGSVVAMNGTSVAAPQIARSLAKKAARSEAPTEASTGVPVDPRLGRDTLAACQPAPGRKRRYSALLGE